MLNYSLIGQNLAYLRKNRKWTQVELANMLNVSHQAISKWERGFSLPDIEMLITLSKTYSTSIDELLNHDITTTQSNYQSKLQGNSSSIISEKMEAVNIWVQALNIFQSKLSRPSYDTWFKQTTAAFDGQSFTIYCQSEFAKEWLVARYSSMILSTMEHILGNQKINIYVQSADSHIPTLELLRHRHLLSYDLVTEHRV
jgi:transcriptional regulator with XRE-family HTH domain